MNAQPATLAETARQAAHRRIEGRLVIATHNTGKLREMRWCSEAVAAKEILLA